MMSHPLARWSSAAPSKRLRALGILVLVVGVAGAGFFYRIETRSAAPTMDDLMPGYSQARSRQIGIMMGDLGVTLMEWLDALKEQRTQAIIIAAVSAVAALACFRVARLLDLPQRDEPDVPRSKF
jgi:type II secretory pathway component PulF